MHKLQVVAFTQYIATHCVRRSIASWSDISHRRNVANVSQSNATRHIARMVSHSGIQTLVLVTSHDVFSALLIYDLSSAIGLDTHTIARTVCLDFKRTAWCAFFLY